MPIPHVRSFAIVACSLFGCQSAAVPRGPTGELGADVFVEAVLVDVPADTLAPVPRSPADAHRLGASRGHSSAVNVVFGGVPDAPGQAPGRRPPPAASDALGACERYDLVPQRVSGNQVAIELTFHGARSEETMRSTVVATEGQLSAANVAGATTGRRRVLYVRTTRLRSLGDFRDTFARAQHEAGGDPPGYPKRGAFVSPNSPTLLVDPACAGSSGNGVTQPPG